MLTGVILAEGPPEGVAVTLAALVPAVIEGLMGDAVVIARNSDPALTAIAEIAGASLALAPPGVNPWQQASSLARREWLLCLQAGDVPGEGWIRALDRFLAAAVRDGRPMGRFARKGGAGQALSGVTAAVAGTRTVRPGDIVRRDWLTAEDRRRVRPLPIAATIERDSFR